MKKAIYAFSGDPITYGHIDVIDRALKVFDELVVGIGVNPDKASKYAFTLEERTEMARKALASRRNVKVISFEGMLADFAYEQNIPIIIRGIRNSADADYEKNFRDVLASQKLGIDVMYLYAQQYQTHLSSSMVKDVQKEQGVIHEFAPLNVKQNLEARISSQYIIGITGEIGSGKSYVSKKLEELAKHNGIPVHRIELDQIGHQILQELEDPAYKDVRIEIAQAFGSSVLCSDGKIDRKKLGDIVFSDPEKLKKLNSIMHTPILVRLRRGSLYCKKGLFLLEAALFAESGITYLCNNNVVLVDADQESQTRRLTQNRKMSPEQIERRLASQYNFEEKKKTLLQKIELENQGKLFVIDNSDTSDAVNINNLFKDIVNYTDRYGELRFRALWDRLGCDGTPDEVYTRLLKAYSQPNRHYHNLSHITRGLAELDEARHLLENPDAVEWALWHHDEIMNKKSKVDEERSAQSAYNTAKHAQLSNDFAEYVKKLVLSTKHNAIPDFNDGKYLVDIDLSIFGRPIDEFREYEENIRKEFSWVPENEFWENRVKVLERFLKRPNIYLTDFFRNKYEQLATDNLGEDRSD